MKYYGKRENLIKRACKNKRVLHIGATSSPYTKEFLRKRILLYEHIDGVCDTQLGIDIAKEDIKLLNRIPNFSRSVMMYHDMNKIADLKEKFDVIIFGETIEHLTDPGNCLETLKKAMHDQTILIITTPNLRNWSGFYQAIFGRDSQHPDHSVGFSLNTLKQLCEKKNLFVKKAGFCTSIVNKHQSTRERITGMISDLIATVFPFLSPTLYFEVTK